MATYNHLGISLADVAPLAGVLLSLYAYWSYSSNPKI